MELYNDLVLPGAVLGDLLVQGHHLSQLVGLHKGGARRVLEVLQLLAHNTMISTLASNSPVSSKSV